MARLTTIRLYGTLGARFGRVHQLAVQTSAEAVKALCINFDGLEQYLYDAKKNGMTFAVFRGKRNIGVQDYRELGGGSDIRIAPIMEGAKKAGLFQTILGAVMVVAGIAISYFSSGTLATFGASLAAGGVGMMAGGVFQILSPNPKACRVATIPITNPPTPLAAQ